MALMRKSLESLRSIENQSEDQYLGRFMCYTIYDMVLSAAFAAIAVTDHVATVVSVMYCLDALCLYWLTSIVRRRQPFSYQSAVARLNMATNAVTLLAFVVLGSYWSCPWLHSSPAAGGSAGGFVSAERLAVVTACLFVAGSKVVKLLAIDSFRAWLVISSLRLINRPDDDAPPALALPGAAHPSQCTRGERAETELQAEMIV